MKFFNFNMLLIMMTIFISPMSMAFFNLNIKMDQMVGNQIVEVNRTVQADYNKEIIIKPEGLKSKIVLNLKKFSNVSVNGSMISPVQVDMKLVNESSHTVGRPQTVTSFYNRTAKFAVHSSGNVNDAADINLSLNFEELN